MKKYYDAETDNASFVRCIDVMAKLIQKYGSTVLEQKDLCFARPTVKLHKQIYTLRNFYFYVNNSDYLQKARKYGHFTGYKN